MKSIQKILMILTVFVGMQQITFTSATAGANPKMQKMEALMKSKMQSAAGTAGAGTAGAGTAGAGA